VSKVLKPEITRVVSEYDLTMLKELYMIESYSHEEKALQDYIEMILTGFNVPYEVFDGNIVGLNHADKPLLSAHMDMVNPKRYTSCVTYNYTGYKRANMEGRWKWNPILKDHELIPEEPPKPEPIKLEKPNKITKLSEVNGTIRGYNPLGERCSLGADDKNGVFTILTLLSMGLPLNFVFSMGEEAGRVGINRLVKVEGFTSVIKDLPYCIVIDRRNGSDIIATMGMNDYCLNLDKEMQKFAEKNDYLYKRASGSICDADTLSEYLECVNISCGYYDPHTKDEYTDIQEIRNTIDFVADLLDMFEYKSVDPQSTYKKPKPATTYGGWSGYGWNNGHNTRDAYYDGRYSHRKEKKDDILAKTSSRWGKSYSNYNDYANDADIADMYGIDIETGKPKVNESAEDIAAEIDEAMHRKGTHYSEYQYDGNGLLIDPDDENFEGEDQYKAYMYEYEVNLQAKKQALLWLSVQDWINDHDMDPELEDLVVVYCPCCGLECDYVNVSKDLALDPGYCMCQECLTGFLITDIKLAIEDADELERLTKELPPSADGETTVLS